MLNYPTILFKLKTSISQMEDSSNWHKTYYNSLLATICLWRFRCCIKKKCFARIRIPLRSGSVPIQKTNTVRNRNNEKTGTGTLCGLGEKNPAIWRSFFLLLFWSQGRLPALPNILQYYTMILPRIRIIEDPDLSDDYRYLWQTGRRYLRTSRWMLE